MKVLVTGGGGFLGGAIVHRLVERGDRVSSFSRREYAHLRALGVELCRGDIADRQEVAKVIEDCELVFHVAAKAGLGGRYRDYYRANVLGTRNVLDACHYHNVKRLVYTSSPSVIFDGGDLEGADESVPYPSHYEAHYPKTKALAEQMVLRANSARLATVALRPHLIWGPGDRHLIPRLLARARSGRLFKISAESKLIDTVYIDNAAEAHLLAADRLYPGSAISGRVYFITQSEPAPLWDIVNRILAGADVPPVQRQIPFPVAYGVGWLAEMAYSIFGPGSEPPMTRFLARELSTAHWFNIDAAARDLGYQAKVSTEEGLRRLVGWLKSLN